MPKGFIWTDLRVRKYIFLHTGGIAMPCSGIVEFNHTLLIIFYTGQIYLDRVKKHNNYLAGPSIWEVQLLVKTMSL